jgi:hypothetical protein
VDEEDGERPLQPPRRRLEAERRAHRPRRQPALAVQEQEGDDANQRRQRHRQDDQGPEQPTAGELRAREEEGERDAEGGGEGRRGERDPEAAPEGEPLVGAGGEGGEVRERGSGGETEGLTEGDGERPTDDPRKKQHQRERREPGRFHRRSLFADEEGGRG